jgi:acyl-CoA dehydrogenase
MTEMRNIPRLIALITRAAGPRGALTAGAGTLDAVRAALAKYWPTDLQHKIVAACLQLFGGDGYMDEYPSSCGYCGVRVGRCCAGTHEIMKVVIARRL